MTFDEGYKSNCQVIGLGFVGLTLAVHLAKKANVKGVDISPRVRASTEQGVPHFHELGLDQPLKEAIHGGKLSLSAKPSESSQSCTYILTVGTPIRGREIDLTSLRRVAVEVAEVAKDSDLVIVRSTVSIGSTHTIVEAALRAKGKSTSVAMCPERTMEGKAMEELTSLPQIVGADSDYARRMASDFFMFHGAKTIELGSSREAELAKLANNTFRDLQFAFANEIADLANKLGISGRRVIEAANWEYPRSSIPKPGPSAGPCLEKDPWILAGAAEGLGIKMRISAASREVNESMAVGYLSHLRSDGQISPEKLGSVVIAGVAFKGTPETDDTRGSMAWPMLQFLKTNWKIKHIYLYDPLIDEANFPSLGEGIVFTRNLHSIEAAAPMMVIIQHNGRTMLDGLKNWLHEAPVEQIVDFWDSKKELALPSSQHIMTYGGNGFA